MNLSEGLTVLHISTREEWRLDFSNKDDLDFYCCFESLKEHQTTAKMWLIYR